MLHHAYWIKLPREEIVEKQIYHGDLNGRFAYFRCEAELPQNATLQAHISANSRYRLWVNEKPVLSGPCKGDLHRQYYDSVDLSPYLQPGKNVFCAQVLYTEPDQVERQTEERAGIYGVISHRIGHRFLFAGEAHDQLGNTAVNLSTGCGDWRVWLDNSFYLKSSEITCFLGAVQEDIDFSQGMPDWKQLSFDASGWKPASRGVKAISDDILESCGVVSKLRLRKREIPLLYETETHFVHCYTLPGGESCPLLAQGTLQIPPRQKMRIVLDGGVVQNGYLHYAFSGGSGCRVTMTYFEKYGKQGEDLVRTDHSGTIYGMSDRVILSGKETVYEPFWFRCFRFIALDVETAGEPVVLHAPTFRKTGYPLTAQSRIHSDKAWAEPLWDISLRTLENCMMDTFMDCPYYEQLQFAMDTRLEALYNYCASQDTALVKKALLDFHYGMLPDGLTAGKYPSAFLQILSTFSLHYLYMMDEYYAQTGDLQSLSEFLPDVDLILSYYQRHTTGQGLVGRLEYWEFVDWQPDWQEFGGTPRALLHGPSTIINLMYAYALGCAQRLMLAAGRKGLAEEYAERRCTLLSQIQSLCWDSERAMYREGPACSQFTRHAQSWAVLNGMVTGKAAQELLLAAMRDPQCLICTFSTAYEWFRALEIAELYDIMEQELTPWIDLLAKGCTTCPETPVDTRSDCHAWSALPLYYFVRVMAGIRPDGIGWSRLIVSPHTDVSTNGTVCTPRGLVHFAYENHAGEWVYRVTLPEGFSGTFVYPNGEIRELRPGENRF